MAADNLFVLVVHFFKQLVVAKSGFKITGGLFGLVPAAVAIGKYRFTAKFVGKLLGLNSECAGFRKET